MKYRLSYHLLFIILFFLTSCDSENEGTNQLTKDQLRHLVGIDIAYEYSFPETFTTDLIYKENGTNDITLTVNSSTSAEGDNRYRPQNQTDIAGTSLIDLSGRSTLQEATVKMQGDAIIPQAEFSITTSGDASFYVNLNGLYNKHYSQFTTLQSKTVNEGTVHEIVYNNVYVFTPDDATVRGYDLTGFKEICFAKDYGFVQIIMEDATSATGEYKLSLVTTFEIPGFENGPISSTGVAGFRHEDQPSGAPLLTNQQLHILTNLKELDVESTAWGLTFTENLNSARFAFSGGEVSWSNYLLNTLGLQAAQITASELEYEKVKQQITDVTGSTINPEPMANSDSLNIGAYKWSIFYLSHVNALSSDEVYATKLGGPFTVEDSLSLHGDFEDLLGFELSTTGQKGNAEISTPKNSSYSVPIDAIRQWILDEENAPSKGGKYENRVFLLNPNYREVGAYAYPELGGAVVRCKN
ncbi:hypothetical protein [Flammeovirga sp. OC4]|uniref:hypothetical protein n=1 Tax=Flammeovirga sp. OC4 TaxID=1382345 RepID=UPI0012E02177|nr:hypothetical protein [Flammeovirga sp. OC4]